MAYCVVPRAGIWALFWEQKQTGRLRPCPGVAYCPKTVFSRRGSPTLWCGIALLYIVWWASQVALVALVQGAQEMQVPSLGLEDPLKEAMATHSGILAWKLPWTEEPGRLQSIGSQSDTTEVTCQAHSLISGLRSIQSESLKMGPWTLILWVLQVIHKTLKFENNYSCRRDRQVNLDWLLLLLLSRFSRVRLCEIPWMAAHRAPPSLGFSRQEHWSGLPFPSPMHESEKWKWSH